MRWKQCSEEALWSQRENCKKSRRRQSRRTQSCISQYGILSAALFYPRWWQCEALKSPRDLFKKISRAL